MRIKGSYSRLDDIDRLRQSNKATIKHELSINSQSLPQSIFSVNNSPSKHQFSYALEKLLPYESYSFCDHHNHNGITKTKNELVQFQKVLVDITRKVLINKNIPDNSLKEISSKLDNLSNEKNRCLHPDEINNTRQLQSELIYFIYSEMKSYDKKISLNDVRELFNRASKEHYNNKEWKVIEKEITYNHDKYLSILTPASQMKYSSDGKDIFYANHYNDKGVSSKSGDETKHAVNLWISDFQNKDNKTLFKGIRHGVISPFMLPKDSHERKEGAINRAKEVALAALFSQPDLYQKALNNEVVTLRMSSTSLLTYMLDEISMLKDQASAWEQLNANNILTLNVPNQQGEIQEIRIKLDVIILNFGVNELAFSVPNYFNGSSKTKTLNNDGLSKILGENYLKNNEIGGWVNEYLSNNPNANNHNKVRSLCQQIKEIWNKKLYKKDGNEPYKMAQRIAMLTYEIGAVPCWNCKSGKDRTGVLDAEVKREVISYDQNHRLNEVGHKLTRKEQSLFQNVLLNSGNLEVQQYNTGVVGSKVAKDMPKLLALSYKERIGNEFVRQQVQGLSSLV